MKLDTERLGNHSAWWSQMVSWNSWLGNLVEAGECASYISISCREMPSWVLRCHLGSYCIVGGAGVLVGGHHLVPCDLCLSMPEPALQGTAVLL